MLKKLRIQNFKCWKDALKEVVITAQFLCSDYVESKYQEQFGT